jgi:uncharacterized protein DUF669
VPHSQREQLQQGEAKHAVDTPPKPAPPTSKEDIMRLNFNPQDYANRSKPNGKSSRYRPVPEGRYTVECIELEAVRSQKGDRMLKATFEILDPPFDDAGFIWDYALLECKANPDALEIARERLAKWAAAAGKPDI